MKQLLVILMLTLGFLNFTNLNSYAATSKSDIYQLLKSNDLTAINNKIKELSISNSKLNNAYQGALMMKKAGLIKQGKEKIEIFKKGAVLLETELRNDPKNVEFRLLRLIIQENAPKVVKYHKNIQEDVSFIKSNYGSCNAQLKKIISDYSKSSARLKI